MDILITNFFQLLVRNRSVKGRGSEGVVRIREGRETWREREREKEGKKHKKKEGNRRQGRNKKVERKFWREGREGKAGKQRRPYIGKS